MKKTVPINLGGYPITIDEDAYAYLDHYLEAVDASFRHLDGHNEILQDIEVRVAELLQEQLKGRMIVSRADVDAVIAIMGRPEDFGEAQSQTSSGGPAGEDTGAAGTFRFRPGKKLYRDMDDKIIGGVCSGLAAYFGIHDPVWVRLIFAILFISGGFGVLLYIVMLIIVPKAETAADRLAMRGEPVNISTIAQAVEKQIEEISEKLSELGDDLKRRKK